MNLLLEGLNTLPMLTWAQTGVNDIKLEEEIADIKEYSKEIFTSPLPQELLVSAASTSFPCENMETGMGKAAEEFVQKNHNTGFTLTVPQAVKIKEPIFISYQVDEKNPSVVDCNTIVAEKDSEITVLINYQSQKDIGAFHGGMTCIYAKENAIVNLIQVQLFSDDCRHFNTLGGLAEKNAQIHSIQVEMGAQKTLVGSQINLYGEESSCSMDIIYFEDKKRMADFNYLVNHFGKATESSIYANGALMDEGQKTFRGTIDFKRGCKKSIGNESEHTLLFSPKAKSRSVPLILCGEDDVKGQHAASTGKIEEGKLFYLMSRGLSEEEAKKLLLEAQFAPVIAKIPDEALQEKILSYVKERLSF